MTTVLVLHAVSDAVWFDHLLGWLKKRYRLVPLESIEAFYSGATESGHACHITVDDGDRSFYDIMFPVLKKHRVHSSLFLSPRMCAEGDNFWFQEIQGYSKGVLRHIAADVLKVPPATLDGFGVESIFKAMHLRQMGEVIGRYRRRTETAKRPAQNISIKEIKEIAASGLVSIGAHTLNHPILRNEDDVICEYEIGACVDQLSDLLGQDVRHFAYPNGIPGLDLGEREVTILKKRGVRMAFTTEARHLCDRDDKLRIPRFAVSDREPLGLVRAKMLLGCSWDWLKRIRGSGEHAERRRLSLALSCSHC